MDYYNNTIQLKNDLELIFNIHNRYIELVQQKNNYKFNNNLNILECNRIEDDLSIKSLPGFDHLEEEKRVEDIKNQKSMYDLGENCNRNGDQIYIDKHNMIVQNLNLNIVEKKKSRRKNLKKYKKSPGDCQLKQQGNEKLTVNPFVKRLLPNPKVDRISNVTTDSTNDHSKFTSYKTMPIPVTPVQATAVPVIPPVPVKSGFAVNQDLHGNKAKKVAKNTQLSIRRNSVVPIESQCDSYLDPLDSSQNDNSSVDITKLKGSPIKKVSGHTRIGKATLDSGFIKLQSQSKVQKPTKEEDTVIQNISTVNSNPSSISLNKNKSKEFEKVIEEYNLQDRNMNDLAKTDQILSNKSDPNIEHNDIINHQISIKKPRKFNNEQPNMTPIKEIDQSQVSDKIYSGFTEDIENVTNNDKCPNSDNIAIGKKSATLKMISDNKDRNINGRIPQNYENTTSIKKLAQKNKTYVFDDQGVGESNFLHYKKIGTQISNIVMVDTTAVEYNKINTSNFSTK